jgi:hypothetical protein
VPPGPCGAAPGVRRCPDCLVQQVHAVGSSSMHELMGAPIMSGQMLSTVL